MTNNTFSPAWNSTIEITNAIASAAAVALPKNANALLLTNTSATARAHVALTSYQSEGDALPTGTAPTTSIGLPILPNQQIVVYVGQSLKVIRAIATAADGVLLVTPGNIW
jgi:hypothetical protein